MSKDRTISKYQEGIIETVCALHQHAITPIKVRNWLTQFSDIEIPIALKVLENLKFFSIHDIINEYDKLLDKILSQVDPIEKIFILGAGEFGKSGTTMIYFLQKTQTFQSNSHRLKILQHHKKIKSQGVKEQSHIIFLDDLVGSGESIVKYYQNEIRHQLIKERFEINIHILCVAYMKEAERFVMSKISKAKLYGTAYFKAFSRHSLAFGKGHQMIATREICYKYGKNLFTKTDHLTRITSIHPLGYKDSQSLIVFAHSVPNNTLPIIWSSKGTWIPLYPRMRQIKLSKIKEFQKESWLYLYLSRKIGLYNKDGQGKEIFDKNDFFLFAVLRLKYHNMIAPTICQVLGITITTYDEIIDNGKDRNMFNNNETLTSEGKKIYSRLAQKMKSGIRISDINYYLEKPSYYVPKKFLGET